MSTWAARGAPLVRTFRPETVELSCAIVGTRRRALVPAPMTLTADPGPPPARCPSPTDAVDRASGLLSRPDVDRPWAGPTPACSTARSAAVTAAASRRVADHKRALRASPGTAPRRRSPSGLHRPLDYAPACTRSPARRRRTAGDVEPMCSTPTGPAPAARAGCGGVLVRQQLRSTAARQARQAFPWLSPDPARPTTRPGGRRYRSGPPIASCGGTGAAGPPATRPWDRSPARCRPRSSVTPPPPPPTHKKHPPTPPHRTGSAPAPPCRGIEQHRLPTRARPRLVDVPGHAETIPPSRKRARPPDAASG